VNDFSEEVLRRRVNVYTGRFIIASLIIVDRLAQTTLRKRAFHGVPKSPLRLAAPPSTSPAPR